MPIIRAADARTEEGTGPNGPFLARLYSDSGGLTQFGAFTETLLPGSRSSLPHWHATEDEFVYVLEGEATVREGLASTVLRPGDAACFRAGDPAGHCIENDRDAPCTYLVVGTRKPEDVVTYPEHDRVLHIGPDRSRRYTTLDGTPDPAPASPYEIDPEGAA